MGDLRNRALAALIEIRRKETYANDALYRAIKKGALSSADTALLTQILYGVLRNRLYLEYLVDKHATMPVGKIEPKVLEIILIGAFQLLFLDKVPDHAAVNESVRLAPKRAAGFTNAILRKIAQYEGHPPKINFADPIDTISITTSHPRWIVEKFIERFGIEEAGQVCLANQNPPANVLRVNRLKNSREELIKFLLQYEINAKPANFSSKGVVVPKLEPVLRSEIYKQGRFMVQGEASQLAVEFLRPEPGEKILDACAAPGGKTTDIAEHVGASGSVVACDISGDRLTKVEQNAKLIGTQNIKCMVADLTRKPPTRIGRGFDKVLVDAPCSGLGELAKNPEARYRKHPDSIAELVRIQNILLERTSRLVKPKGCLVYATCSLTLDENEGVVEAFLARHPEYKLEDAKDSLGAGLESFISDQGYFLATPHTTGTSGFFAARMTRMKYA